ncbi:acyltransferase [Christensenellaceae bacterium 44-20]
MDFLVICLFLSMIAFRKQTHEDYLSLGSFTALKGLMAMVVVFHHLAQIMPEEGYCFRLFTDIGPYAVAVFFLLSGFGLSTQFRAKGKAYFDGYFKKLLLKIVLPYLVMNLIYYFFRGIVLGEGLTLASILSDASRGVTLVTHSWFIIAILLFYTAFYLCFRGCRNSWLANISIYLLVFAYVYACKRLEFGYWWYQSSLAFGVGVTWGCYQDRLGEPIRKSYPAILYAGALLLWAMIRPMSSEAHVLIALLRTALFAVLAVLVGRKAKYDSRPLEFLGKRSLEIYMVQGLVMLLLRSDLCYIKSDFWYAAAAAAGSILLGCLLHLLFAAMRKRLGSAGK